MNVDREITFLTLAHSEVILLAMLTDSDPEIKQRAIDKILECRSEDDNELSPIAFLTLTFKRLRIPI